MVALTLWIEILDCIFIGWKIIEIFISKNELFIAFKAPELLCSWLDIIKFCVRVYFESLNEAALVNLFVFNTTIHIFHVYFFISISIAHILVKLWVKGFSNSSEFNKFHAYCLKLSDWLWDTWKDSGVTSHIVERLTKPKLNNLIQVLDSLWVTIVPRNLLFFFYSIIFLSIFDHHFILFPFSIHVFFLYYSLFSLIVLDLNFL